MCECGCTMNDRKYSLPGPGTSIYIITLSGACVDCDAPVGMCIEQIDPSSFQYQQYLCGDLNIEPVKFEYWPESKGISIVAGKLKREFIDAMLPHLIGINSHEFGENGVIDKDGAEVLAEEMYEDAQARPVMQL